MLGFLFGRKKPILHKATCPMCELEASFDLGTDPPKEPYPFDDTLQITAKAICPFCKIEQAICFADDGNVVMRDPKWNQVEHEYYQIESQIEDEIADLECDLDDDEDLTAKQKTTIAKKIDSLRKKLERLEESFTRKEEAYEDRRCRWQGKAEDKFGG